MELPDTLNSQSDSEEEEQSWDIMLLDFKIQFNTIVIKTGWYVYKN